MTAAIIAEAHGHAALRALIEAAAEVQAKDSDGQSQGSNK